MSRVLFDVNVPRPIARLLIGHIVEFADQRSWRELTNGDLLTADSNLRYQQNLATRRIAIVALSTNARPVIRVNPAPVIRAVDAASPGSYLDVRLARPPLRRPSAPQPKP